MIEDLKQKERILTDAGLLVAYLRLRIDRWLGSRISLKEPAFIDQIIEQCGLKDQRLHDAQPDTIINCDEDAYAT